MFSTVMVDGMKIIGLRNYLYLDNKLVRVTDMGGDEIFSNLISNYLFGQRPTINTIIWIIKVTIGIGIKSFIII